MNDHDPHDGSRLGNVVGKLLVILLGWCLAVLLVAVTVRLVEWIWP